MRSRRWRLAFNAENQITQMDGGAAVYAYDGEGRRIKKTVGSETTYYFYGVTGLLCEFTTTNTGATQAASTDRATYRTSDKLGSAVLIINASGTVIENNRTLPYGEAWSPEVASTNDKKFTTYERDQESGLDYAGSRFYASSSGRFSSVDSGPYPGSVPASLNRYVSNLNDPVNFTDRDGGCARTEIVSVAVGNVTYRTVTTSSSRMTMILETEPPAPEFDIRPEHSQESRTRAITFTISSRANASTRIPAH